MQGKTTTKELITAIANAQRRARAGGALVCDRQSKDGWWYPSKEQIDRLAGPALDETGLALIPDGFSTRRDGDCWFMKAQWTLVHVETGQMRLIPVELPFDPEDNPGERISVSNAAKGAVTSLERYLLLTLLRIQTRDPEEGEVPGPPRPGRRVVGPEKSAEGTVDDPIPVDSVAIEEQINTLVTQADRADGVEPTQDYEARIEIVAAAPLTEPEQDDLGAGADLVALSKLDPVFKTARPAILAQCHRATMSFEEWLAVQLDCAAHEVPREVPRVEAVRLEKLLETMIPEVA